MKKWEKYLSIFILILSTLIIIILLAASLLRNFILRQAIHYANRNLLVKIDFDKSNITLLQDFPNAQIHFYNLTITGKGDFADDTLLYVPDIEFTIDVEHFSDRPQQITIKEIDATQPRLNLLVNPDGIANYYFFPTKEDITTTASPFYILVKNLNIFRGKAQYLDYESNVFVGSDNATANFVNLKMSGQSAEFFLSAIFENSYIKSKKNYLLRNVDLSIESDYKNIFPSCQDNYYFNGKFSINQLKFSANGIFKNSNLCDSTNHYHFYLLKIKALTKNFRDLLSVINVFSSTDLSKINAQGTYKINLTYMSQRSPAKDTSRLHAKINIINGYAQIPHIKEEISNINLLAVLELSHNLKFYVNYANFNILQNYFHLSRFKINDTKDKIFLSGLLNAKIDLDKITPLFKINNYKLQGLLNTHVALSGYLNKTNIDSINTLAVSGFAIIQNFTLNSEKYRFHTPYIGSYISNKQIFITTQNACLDSTQFSSKVLVKNYIPFLLPKKFHSSQPLSIKAQANINSIDLNSFSADSSTHHSLLPIPLNKNILADIHLSIDTITYGKLTFNNLHTIISTYPDSLWIKSLQVNFGNTLISLTSNISPINKNLFINFATDITGIEIPSLTSFLDLNDTVKNFLSSTQGTFDLGMSGSLIYHSSKPNLQNLYITGKILSSRLQLPENEYTNKTAKILKIPQLNAPYLTNLDLYFRYQNNSVIIPRSKFTVSEHPAILEGYYSVYSQLINFTFGIQMSRQEILRVLHKTLTGEDHAFVYLTVLGKASDPKMRISANILTRTSVANLSNQSIQTKALADSLRAARVVQKQQKKQAANETKILIKQTRKRARMIMRKAREIAHELMQQNTPQAHRKARKVIRNARRMRRQLLKQATQTRKLRKKQAKSKIHSTTSKYKKLKKRLKKLIPHTSNQ